MQKLLTVADTRHVSQWSSPGRGLWVASDGQYYRGMIERVDSDYIATDGHGVEVGRFSTLTEAKLSLNGEIQVRELAVGV